MIGPETPVRRIGDVTYSTWVRVFSEVDSSIPDDQWEDCYDSCRPHSAMALAVALKESQLGKTAPARSNNALGIGPNRSFDIWADGFADFVTRLNSVAVPYTPVDISLRRFVQIYVGGPRCPGLIERGRPCANGESIVSIALYEEQTISRINAWLNESVPEPSPPSSDPVFGRVPKPANLDVRLVYNSTAWDDLGSRRINAILLHRMLGTLDGTDAYFRNEAAGSALTDFGIGLGKVYQWNDPFATVNGVWRAPWANGPATDVEGNGTAYFNRYGISAVNRDVASVEIAGYYDDPVPMSDLDRVIETVAWIADRARISWRIWPKNNDGIHCLLGHFEFSPKLCPGSVVIGLMPEIEERVFTRLRFDQGGMGQSPAPPPPRFPGLTIPEPAFLTLFPEAKPGQPFTNYYLKHWAPRGVYPSLRGIFDGEDGARYGLFPPYVLVYRNGKVELLRA